MLLRPGNTALQLVEPVHRALVPSAYPRAVGAHITPSWRPIPDFTEFPCCDERARVGRTRVQFRSTDSPFEPLMGDQSDGMGRCIRLINSSNRWSDRSAKDVSYNCGSARSHGTQAWWGS